MRAGGGGLGAASAHAAIALRGGRTSTLRPFLLCRTRARVQKLMTTEDAWAVLEGYSAVRALPSFLRDGAGVCCPREQPLLGV